MSFKLLRQFALVFGLAAVIAGCGGVNPPTSRLPELSFRGAPPFRLNIARIEVVNKYTAPAGAPHIEYDMPVSPEQAVKRWVEDRLQPVGRSGTLRVVINEASATETPLKTDQGLTGVFKKEQAARVDMSVNVVLQMLDERQFVIADVSGDAMRSSTEPEGQKLNERDRFLYDMVADLIKGMDAKFGPNVPVAFGQWLGTP